ncbi:MAG: hypothetical protein M3N54_07010 [Acidobacteriota bacterium]|nr:hypothetical protein [Acidobacteriota bacterium]
MSPLDWALVETWKSAEVPLEAVLRGIDSAFEKWRAKRSRAQLVNSLAWCSQAVLAEAQRMADGGQGRPAKEQPAPFPADDLRRFIEANTAAIRATDVKEYGVVADSLDEIAAALGELSQDLEALEERLSVLEQTLISLARSRQTEEQALAARRELEAYLKPYRSRMTAPQISMLQTQFLERTALESAALPRLSLFYLR